MILTAGQVYTVRVTVTNQSTRAGQPVAATFDVTMISNFTTLKRATVDIPANGSVIIDFPLSLPTNASGSGSVRVAVLTPTGAEIASANVEITVGAPPGEVQGHVYDMITNAPLVGVSIKIGGYTGQTNTNGDYFISGIPVGNYSATFSLSGYETTGYVSNFSIRDGTNTVNVGLMPLPKLTNLQGIVRDAFTNSLIAGVLVTVTGYRTTLAGGTKQVYYEAITNSSGLYSFRSVEATTFTISFIRSDYQTRIESISLLPDVVNQYNVALTSVVTGLRLYFSNPKKGAVVWDAKITDLSTMLNVSGNPTGIKELHIPMDFSFTSTVFLLRVAEVPAYPQPGPYWFGPYLVEIPVPNKAYTWDSGAGKIDGIKAVDMPNTANESLVTGVITGFSWISEGQWGVSLSVERADQVSGENWVTFFKSLYIRYATMPLDSLGAPVLKVGDKVTCSVKMFWDVYDAQWKAWNFNKWQPYPPAAYNFSGYVTVGGVVRKQYTGQEGQLIWADFRQIFWSVSGGIPPFSVTLVTYGLFGNVTGAGGRTGPASGTSEVLEDAFQFGYEGRMAIYAHPNPNAPEWGQYTWDVDGWKLVASN